MKNKYRWNLVLEGRKKWKVYWKPIRLAARRYSVSALFLYWQLAASAVMVASTVNTTMANQDDLLSQKAIQALPNSNAWLYVWRKNMKTWSNKVLRLRSVIQVRVLETSKKEAWLVLSWKEKELYYLQYNLPNRHFMQTTRLAPDRLILLAQARGGGAVEWRPWAPIIGDTRKD